MIFPQFPRNIFHCFCSCVCVFRIVFFSSLAFFWLVANWEFSNSLSSSRCLRASERALPLPLASINWFSSLKRNWLNVIAIRWRWPGRRASHVQEQKDVYNWGERARYAMKNHNNFTTCMGSLVSSSRFMEICICRQITHSIRGGFLWLRIFQLVSSSADRISQHCDSDARYWVSQLIFMIIRCCNFRKKIRSNNKRKWNWQ